MPVKEIMKKHKLTSYSNVYAIVKGEKKRTKENKKVWKRKVRVMTEPTDPVILRLRTKYRNYDYTIDKEAGQIQSEIIQPFITVRPKQRYRLNHLG